MKILIAEDEEDIALIYKKALESRNHQVRITSDGEECLRTYHDIFQERISSKTNMIIQYFRLPFDVVVLDYKMPQINGMEVAKEILAVNPHQRIIFASAYVRETLQNSIKQLKQVVELMQKPFTIKKLVDIIKAVNPTHEQITDLLERLREIGKGTF
jgi:CheY-like chemotaxis protein